MLNIRWGGLSLTMKTWDNMNFCLSACVCPAIFCRPNADIRCRSACMVLSVQKADHNYAAITQACSKAFPQRLMCTASTRQLSKLQICLNDVINISSIRQQRIFEPLEWFAQHKRTSSTLPNGSYWLTRKEKGFAIMISLSQVAPRQLFIAQKRANWNVKGTLKAHQWIPELKMSQVIVFDKKLVYIVSDMSRTQWQQIWKQIGHILIYCSQKWADKPKLA